MWEFIQKNQMLSGSVMLVVPIGLGLWHFFFKEKNEKEEKEEKKTSPTADLEAQKTVVSILFIDDLKFRTVEVLQNDGWKNTKRIKDLRSLDDQDVVSADIIFVDIQGVGKLLGFQDEGLGLAKAIKDKHPDKCVVIYSAESEGDRFHEALKAVDHTIPKNSDPYIFIKIIEERILQNNG